MIDARIPLGIRQPDTANALLRGTQAAGTANSVIRDNRLAQTYAQHGAGILSGDMNALNALAGVDPRGALQARQAHQQMQHAEERLRLARAAGARAAANVKSREEAQRLATEAAESNRIVAMAMADPENADRYFANSPLTQEYIGQDPAVVYAGIQGFQGNLQGVWEMSQEPKADYAFADGHFYDQNDPQAGAQPIPGFPQKAGENVTMGDRLVNRDTGEVVADFSEDAPAYDVGDVDNFRKEVSGDKRVQEFDKQATAFTRIQQSASDPSAAGDLALIFNYMKLLDPGSVVRESEFATAANAAGVPERVRNVWNRVLSGERLGDDQRSDFVGRADRLYDGALKDYDALIGEYRSVAERRGYPEEEWLMNRAITGRAGSGSPEIQLSPEHQAILDKYSQ